jgi:hypothetical protein
MIRSMPGTARAGAGEAGDGAAGRTTGSRPNGSHVLDLQRVALVAAGVITEAFARTMSPAIATTGRARRPACKARAKAIRWSLGSSTDPGATCATWSTRCITWPAGASDGAFSNAAIYLAGYPQPACKGLVA